MTIFDRWRFFKRFQISYLVVFSDLGQYCLIVQSLLVRNTSERPDVYKNLQIPIPAVTCFVRHGTTRNGGAKSVVDNFRQMAFLRNFFKNLIFGDLRQYYVKCLHSDIHHSPER